MTVFLINIPSSENEDMYRMCQDILIDYFNKYNIKVFTLTENKWNIHPSWLKMKCFDYINDDFVLCWDLDLLPKKNCPSIIPHLDFDKINMVEETGRILGQHSFTDGENLKLGQFKYNCGLIGIPLKYKNDIEYIFSTYKDSSWPCWEQYHFNKHLSKNNFKDINELNKSWNCMYHPRHITNSFINSAKSVHITGLNVNGHVTTNSNINGNIRKKLIELYYNLYFSKNLN